MDECRCQSRVDGTIASIWAIFNHAIGGGRLTGSLGSRLRHAAALLAGRPSDRLYVRRAGGDNIWVMNSDGSSPRAITARRRVLNNPTWSRMGVILPRASISRPSARSAPAKSGSTSERDGKAFLVQRPSPSIRRNLGEPAFSASAMPFISAATRPRARLRYAQDSNQQVFCGRADRNRHRRTHPD